MHVSDHPLPTLLLTVDGTVLEANAAACALTGLEAERFRGVAMERVFAAVEGGASPEHFLGELMQRRQARFDGHVLGAGGARQRVTAFGFQPGPPGAFWVHLVVAPAPRVAAPAPAWAAAPDPYAHLPPAFRAVLAHPTRAEALFRVGGIMGAHARELLGTLLRLGQALRGLPATQPLLMGLSHAATALAENAEKLAELTGTAGELAPEKVDLRALLAQTTVLLEGSLPQGIHVGVQLDPATPPAWCHGLALQQALLALCDHAREAMPVGGHLLLQALPGPDADTVVIHVRDNGRPPDSDDDDRDRTLGHGRRGMGLALPLVRELMDRMGGEVAHDSELSVGSAVTLTLPARPDTPGVSTGGRPRILLVDDDVELRRVTARLLEQSGMLIRTAGDGAEALALLSGEEHFAGMLLDMHMPRADGADVLRFVQVMEHAPAVVVFTAGDVAKVRQDLAGLGAFDVLAKPFHGRQLVETLRAAIRARAS
ncbi:MAG: response regulator [Deltaproteobacteria bacterium]|nr:response regulator [Deltaproteobacteria bacterium]